MSVNVVDYSTLPHHRVLCLDMKSFYASCECVRLGLDPLTTYLVVVGDQNREGGVILASTPLMKAEYGIKSGNRLFEVPRLPHILIQEANMAYYLDQSVAFTRILQDFVPLEAIHVYSVDEAWVTVDGTERLFGSTWEVAERIKNTLKEKLGLTCCVGIGPNKFLAKVVMDNYAKKSGIAECDYGQVEELLWPLPLKEIWGIGSRLGKRLNSMGIRTLGQLAKTPLHTLKKKFGIMGEQLYWHSWGVDLSPVYASWQQESQQKGFGHTITLLRDYTDVREIQTVMLELSEEVCRRARHARMAGRTVSLGIGYSREAGGGFHRSRTVSLATNITMDVYRVCLELFRENYTGGVVRRVGVSLSHLEGDEEFQLDLFKDQVKERKLGYVMDSIRSKYGSTALLRASTYTSGGVARERSTKIGGHKA